MAGRKGAAIAEGEGGSTAIEMRQVFWRMVAQGPSGLGSNEVEIPSEEATRKMPEVSGKHPVEAPSGQWKKAKVLGRHKSRHEGEKSKSRATKGKKPTTSIEETPTPRVRSKSVKELSTHPGEDGRDYHVIRVSSRPEHAPDAPLEVHLSQLTHIMWIWQDGEASVKYV
ncbi:hypothetical protein BHE74_00023467 [Ensete ventricosum]|nr:hypothetical protein BHE74_00023467 [Ensete ventricosum]